MFKTKKLKNLNCTILGFISFTLKLQGTYTLSYPAKEAKGEWSTTHRQRNSVQDSFTWLVGLRIRLLSSIGSLQPFMLKLDHKAERYTNNLVKHKTSHNYGELERVGRGFFFSYDCHKASHAANPVCSPKYQDLIEVRRRNTFARPRTARHRREEVRILLCLL